MSHQNLRAAALNRLSRIKPLCVLPVLAVMIACGEDPVAPPHRSNQATPSLAAEAAAGYKLVKLPSIEAGETRALAINRGGDVVGYGTDADGLTHATVWPTSGEARELRTLGGRASSALGINDAGDIVGNSDAEDGAAHATLWQAGVDEPVDLGLAGGTDSYATAIDALGNIVGYVLADGIQPRAMLWTADAHSPKTLWFSDISQALAINARGDIAGFSYTGLATPRLFLWNVDGRTARNLSGDVYSRAMAINDRGDMAGTILIDGLPLHAAVWPAANYAGPVDLGRLSGGESFANAIDLEGNVAGTDFQTPASSQAVVWYSRAYDRPLPLGGNEDRPTRARAMNAGGTIAGSGVNADGNIVAMMWLPIKTNHPPTVVAPRDISTFTAGGSCSATVDVGTATANDDQPGVELGSARSDGREIADAYPKGETVIAWTARDASGLTATAVQSIRVKDAESPMVTPPANRSVDNDPHQGSARVSVGTASATDNCGLVTVAGTRSDGATLDAAYPVGITVITWMATDGSENSGSATQLITVRDAEPPTLSLPPGITVNATSPAGAVVEYRATAVDNIAVAPPVCGPLSGSIFPIGATVVACTAMDATGNRVSGSFSVTVRSGSQQIASLIESLSRTPIASPQRNALIAFLDAALANARNTRLACASLELFIRAVRARTGTVFTPAQAAQLSEDVRRIEAVLGCG